MGVGAVGESGGGDNCIQTLIKIVNIRNMRSFLSL